jgi:hypothetical protein
MKDEIEEEFDREEDLNMLVPSIRKNFQSSYESNIVKCLYCGQTMSKRVMTMADHDGRCAGKENKRKIAELEEKYKSKEIAIEQFNEAALQIFEMESDGIDLSQCLFFRVGT